jgi:hypothetical protein
MRLSVVALVILAGCHDTPTDPADRLSVRREIAHYVYLHAVGDAVDTTTPAAWAERRSSPAAARIVID